MSPDGRDIFDNPNKQSVRERHWEPCFGTINKEIDSWKNRGRPLRYLCFPGQNVIFIKYLLEKNLFDRKTFVVAVEEEEERVIKIRIELSKILDRQNYFIYLDSFEKLIIDNDEFCNKFPFDILGMDLTKFVLKTDRRSPRAPILEALQNLFINQQRAINKNLVRINKFYLILTSNMDVMATSDDFVKYNRDKIKYLIEKILREFADLLNHPYLDELVTKTKLNQKEKKRVVIISIILPIISLASNYFNIELNDDPIYYKGRRGGKKMVGLVFLCKKRNLRVNSSVRENKLRIRNMNDSINKLKETIFLPEPES